jgi:hypothetical protein
MKYKLLRALELIAAGVLGGISSIYLQTNLQKTYPHRTDQPITILESGHKGLVLQSEASRRAKGEFFANSSQITKIKVCTRSVNWGSSGKIAFREFTINADGSILHIGEECDGMLIYPDSSPMLSHEQLQKLDAYQKQLYQEAFIKRLETNIKRPETKSTAKTNSNSSVKKSLRSSLIRRSTTQKNSNSRPGLSRLREYRRKREEAAQTNQTTTVQKETTNATQSTRE